MKYAAALSLAALAAAAPTTQEASHIALPERRSVTRSDGSVDAKALVSELARAVHKYNPSADLSEFQRMLAHAHAHEKRAGGTANNALTDQVEDGTDLLYYGTAQVGASNPQTFTVDFDTGSADFFVPGPSCGAAQGCVGTTKYSQGGTKEGNTTSVTYGSGQVSGNNYFDTVAVSGLTATHTNVISLTQASGFNDSASNSLMGMGFSTIANSKQPTFFENLISQGKVAQPAFSFYLGRAASGTASASQLTLGGTDATKYTGALSAVPVTTKGYWQVALDAVYVNAKKALFTAGQAAIDTGTTVIIAPSLAASSIYANIPGSRPLLSTALSGFTTYAYPCASNPKVAIQFGGKQYAINSLDFNLGSVSADFFDILGVANPFTGAAASTQYCAAAIFSGNISPTQNLYVVGDSFLKNWYSVYSYANGASVSFAAAKGNQ